MEDLLVVQFLHLGVHVVTDLTNAVADGVTDAGILVVVALQHHSHDRLDGVDFLDVLAHLTQGHDRGVGVAPVAVLEHLEDEFTQNGEHVLLANSGHEAVDGLNTERDLVGVHFAVFLSIGKTLFG